MSDDTLRVDIDQILQARLPRHYRYIPRWVVGWLKRTVHEDAINEIMASGAGLKDVEFARHVLNCLHVDTTATGMEHLEEGKRYIFASNHPLGGLDGLALITLMGQRYGNNLRFMVNDLLMAVKPMTGIFLPVNKFGRQSRQAAELIGEQYNGDNQMLTFPAGLCSRMQPDGTVADLAWNKHVIARAIHDHRDVVPVHVNSTNSRFFYRLARWRKRLGIKFNIEMLYLPDEMYRKRGETIPITVGTPIPWQSLDAAHPLDEAARLRGIVYELKKDTL